MLSLQREVEQSSLKRQRENLIIFEPQVPYVLRPTYIVALPFLHLSFDSNKLSLLALANLKWLSSPATSENPNYN